MHIYLHVPFCARRCTYCDFAIAVRRQVPSDGYVTAVLQEWALWQAEPIWDDSPEIETIYLGGGTPSRLEPDAVALLIDRLARDRPLSSNAELTLEANPDDVTSVAAASWKAAGINRVSLGVQSFDPAVLQWMHRTHDSRQAVMAVDTLRSAGFRSLSLDLIFGLPSDLLRDWEHDLEQALALEPEHLSLYGLTIEAGTPLGRQAQRGEVAAIDDDRYAAEFLAGHRTLVSAGYVHYEVSNAARPGHQARHNSAYWRRSPYIGLGPSAHSGFGAERRWNIREWEAYQRAVLAGCRPMAGRELLGGDAVALEDLYLGLRTDEGVPLARIRDSIRGEWERSGWAVSDPERLRLTPEGWLRLDALVAAAAS
jgi:oxygen-independent coproporphyrinogen-3 oxidase